ncbi:hypothetical protein pb186bvf_004457 [Paramecium bursaria]
MDQIKLDLAEIRKAIPPHLFKKSESRFLVSVFQSISMTAVLTYLAYNYIPFSLWALPIWVAYAALTGTVATGLWVLGHECGHGSFSQNKLLNDILGYILHTILLVPYFSWQHSHGVHHSKTNHLTEGETHNPVIMDSKMGRFYTRLRDIIGPESFAAIQIFNIAVLGWPLYLLTGVTGGSARGFTSHFIVPNQLFPPRLLFKVCLSNVGLMFIIYLLYLWGQQRGFGEVFALYLGPYLVVNAWLTIITFLQHTDQNVPHYDEKAWTWLRGAVCTIDRNYPLWIDALQYEIGTTHVVHHIFSELPHYNAREANHYVKAFVSFKRPRLIGVKHKGDGVWQFA